MSRIASLTSSIPVSDVISTSNSVPLLSISLIRRFPPFSSILMVVAPVILMLTVPVPGIRFRSSSASGVALAVSMVFCAVKSAIPALNSMASPDPILPVGADTITIPVVTRSVDVSPPSITSPADTNSIVPEPASTVSSVIEPLVSVR